MMKRVELPLLPPMYSAYHNQSLGTATIINNPSIRNWYLNQSMNLQCSKKFLSGYTTPQLDIVHSIWYENPCFDRVWLNMRFTRGYINPIIRDFLNNGFYVLFTAVDDYYVEGKSWYKERHFIHDGIICGYDQNDKTYCLYAYDKNWIYQKFWTSQKSFNAGRKGALKAGVSKSYCGFKPSNEQIPFDPQAVVEHLKEYLDSSLEKYPPDEEGLVYGTVVHDYLAMYVECLYKEEIPYERLDRRIFRLLWEHKKAMQERLERMEQVLNLNHEASEAYSSLIAEANTIRMLYASHHMRRRDSVLPIIQKKLLTLRSNEEKVLDHFLKTTEGKIGK